MPSGLTLHHDLQLLATLRSSHHHFSRHSGHQRVLDLAPLHASLNALQRLRRAFDRLHRTSQLLTLHTSLHPTPVVIIIIVSIRPLHARTSARLQKQCLPHMLLRGGSDNLGGNMQSSHGKHRVMTLRASTRAFCAKRGQQCSDQQAHGEP